jgi:hypothetical protein
VVHVDAERLEPVERVLPDEVERLPYRRVLVVKPLD